MANPLTLNIFELIIGLILGIIVCYCLRRRVISKEAKKTVLIVMSIVAIGIIIIAVMFLVLASLNII